MNFEKIFSVTTYASANYGYYIPKKSTPHVVPHIEGVNHACEFEKDKGIKLFTQIVNLPVDTLPTLNVPEKMPQSSSHAISLPGESKR